MSSAETPVPPSDRRPLGFLALIGACLWTALVTGVTAGIVDGFIAWSHFRTLPETAVAETRIDRWSDLAGGGAAAAALYAGLQLAWLLPAGVVAWLLLLRRPSEGVARGLVLGAGLAAGMFVLSYWHTRELFFYGMPATSPPRLAVTAALALGALIIGLVAGQVLVRFGPGFRRWSTVNAAIIAGCGVVWAWAQDQSTAERGAINERNQDVPNVVLIVIDALRADVLGCYGNATVKTPHIDALAAGGVVFETAYANAPFTGTSFASFFTGQHFQTATEFLNSHRPE